MIVRIFVQFLGQIVGLHLLRTTRPDVRAAVSHVALSDCPAWWPPSAGCSSSWPSTRLSARRARGARLRLIGVSTMAAFFERGLRKNVPYGAANCSNKESWT